MENKSWEYKINNLHSQPKMGNISYDRAYIVEIMFVFAIFTK